MNRSYALSLLTVLGLALASPNLSVATSTQDPAEEIKALKEAVAKLEETGKKEGEKVKAIEAELAKIQAWFKALPAVCKDLDARVDSARANGFEKAGPNPDAKKDVLDGLKSLAKALNAANPVVKPEPPEEKENEDGEDH